MLRRIKVLLRYPKQRSRQQPSHRQHSQINRASEALLLTVSRILQHRDPRRLKSLRKCKMKSQHEDGEVKVILLQETEADNRTAYQGRYYYYGWFGVVSLFLKLITQQSAH